MTDTTTPEEPNDIADNSTDNIGDTEAAGAGLSDAQFAERVAGQTSSDLQAADIFEREADAASTDEPVADVTGDDLNS